MKKIELLTGRVSSQIGKGRLRKGIEIALAGTILVSGMANAVLRDRGPVRSVGTTTLPADFFPDWYRETADAGGLAIGQCIYQDDAGSGPLCLTSTADALPDRFAGNIGDEAFYAASEINIPITGGDLLWIGNFEMAYLTADGSPPAVRNAADPQEVVFSRERIRIDLPVTGDNSCAGDYIVRTPFAVHNFTMEEGGRALFYTNDITPIPGDMDAALKGLHGPFLKWDVGVDGVNPVSATNPAIVFTPPVGPVRKYIGDPNIEHLFVGSTIPAGPGHLEKTFNNYVEIIPPAGCNLGAGAGQPLFNDLAAISGPIWDLPIVDPIAITKATYVRNGATAALDVWADGTKNHNVVLTASTDASQHLPSVTMQEEKVAGVATGRYHAHLEFDNGAVSLAQIPSSVTVTDLTSNPTNRSSSGVVDAVIVTKSVFEPVTRKLCIAAHSGDETSPVPLSLNSPAYGAFGPATGTCPAVAVNDVVLDVDLDNFNPDTHFIPKDVIVQSNLGGKETSQPVSLADGTASDALVLLGAVSDSFDNIQGTGTTALDLTGVAFDNTPSLVKLTASADTTPGNFRIVVISQPNDGTKQVGTVTAPISGGTVTYTAEEGMDASNLTFYYAIQDTVNNTVTNVARVDLSVDKTIPPPVGVADRQGVFRTTAGAVIPVLANDTTGLSATPIDITSVQIATQGTRGNAVANASGTITYTPVGQGATANNTIDTFTYTVANTAGVRSAPITVQVALKTAAEAVAFQRVRWNGSRWDIRFTSTYAGPAGAITLAPSAQCRLTANGAGGQIGDIGGPVVPGAGTNAYVNVANSPAAVGNNYTVNCTTSSGGSGNRTGQL
ncbi:IPT/TIG domain-containing protein [Methyloglobulus morosus KoM1]|uniref:IPT/TIG domain-containing protein n=1 Tax=Methyloglobulus morosus KoM1 TaxID=1116472 RepID=V5CAP5_9GAMM|nr:Ig-like domain-containing protein [Methyloglobulus morosus]ESS73888.1 IPT/TIG domain-containing protein [Methyloglobulus morosus KoM1]